MRRTIILFVATAAVMVTASASAMTLPTRVKLTVSGASCRFSRVVLVSAMQTTLARRCSGTAVARVRLPRTLKRSLTVRRGETWVIKLRELP
jgi:hypothetical protein